MYAEHNVYFDIFEMEHEMWLKYAFNGQKDKYRHYIISQFFSCSSIDIRSMKEH